MEFDDFQKDLLDKFKKRKLNEDEEEDEDEKNKKMKLEDGTKKDIIEEKKILIYDIFEKVTEELIQNYCMKYVFNEGEAHFKNNINNSSILIVLYENELRAMFDPYVTKVFFKEKEIIHVQCSCEVSFFFL
jgi:hypothetical protein